MGDAPHLRVGLPGQVTTATPLWVMLTGCWLAAALGPASLTALREIPPATHKFLNFPQSTTWKKNGLQMEFVLCAEGNTEACPGRPLPGPWREGPQPGLGAHRSAIRTDQETSDCLPTGAVTGPRTLQALLMQRRAPATGGAQGSVLKPESA